MENPEKKQDDKQINNCSTIGCEKPANFQCPTCITLCLPPAHFCSQDCFKAFWPFHKNCHKKVEEVNKIKDKFAYSGPLRPGKISARSFVPDHIKRPDYALNNNGTPFEEINSKFQEIIEVKDFKQIEKLREVSILARKTLDYGHSTVKPGITTDEIDKAVHKFIIDNDAYPSPLNYYKFPKSLCTSVNEVICHGIPDSRPLEEGDIVNLDITIFKHGVHSDLNETYHVGEVSQSSKFLVESSYRCLEKAIEMIKPGTMYRDIGNVIQKYIEEKGLSITKTYCGHGIGGLFHCAPTVPHYGKNKAKGIMKAGNVFTIEPMINQGTYKDILWPDDWTVVTADGQRSSQFEHTFLVTDGGVEILTGRLPESPPLNFNC